MKKNRLQGIGILTLVLLLIFAYGFINYDEIINKLNTSDDDSNNDHTFVYDENYFSDGSLNYKTGDLNDFNIVFIVLDTVRPDHMSAYGYERETSPNIDKIAKEGVVFTNAFTPIPYTTASHISLMTGLYPFVYQPRNELSQPTGIVIIDDKYLTLAEILNKIGYNTAAFISVDMMSTDSGLNQGFKTYNYSAGVRQGNETTKLATEWLENNYEEKFFLWVHDYDAHDAYNPPEPYFSKFKDYEELSDNISINDFTTLKDSIARYDGDINLVDNTTGLILNKITQLGIENNTLIIIVSDHGEQFGEHNVPIYQGMGPQVIFEHARTLYDQETKIVMIMKQPLILPAGKVVDSIVENIDIMPTILSMIGLKDSTSNQGKDMIPAIKEGIDIKKYSISHLYPIISNYYKTSIRSDKFKLIYDHHNKETKFFNLIKDPRELENLYEKEHMQIIIKEYEEELINIINQNTYDTEITVSNTDSKIHQNLLDLGYKI